MARLTDHDIRDADHAARMELTLIQGKYARRMLESAKAHIQDEIETAAREGRSIDGTAVGRAAAARAALPYFGALAGTFQPAIEGSANSAAQTATGVGLGPRG